MTTQAEFLTKVRRRLYELNANRFSDEMLRDWLNDACDDASRRTQCLRTDGTIALSADQQNATPSFEDILAVHAVKFTPTASPNTDYELEYYDYHSAAQVAWNGLNNSSGRPSIFWMQGFPPALEFWVYPTPSEAGTLTVHYYRTFTKLSVEDDTDAAVELGFPSGWDDMLVAYVMAEALLSDRDQRHQTYRDLYEQRLGAFADTTIRYTDQTGTYMPAGRWGGTNPAGYGLDW